MSVSSSEEGRRARRLWSVNGVFGIWPRDNLMLRDVARDDRKQQDGDDTGCCKMRRSCKRTNLMLTAVIGRWLARSMVFGSRLDRAIYGADDERALACPGGIGHPARRQQRAQHHRDKREMNGGEPETAHHDPSVPVYSCAAQGFVKCAIVSVVAQQVDACSALGVSRSGSWPRAQTSANSFPSLGWESADSSGNGGNPLPGWPKRASSRVIDRKYPKQKVHRRF